MYILTDSILFLITVLHMIVVLFIIITPFTNSNYLLTMHAFIVPFIIFHWWMSSNICSLTVAENYVRSKLYPGSPIDDCFTYKFIAPIYDFNKNYENYSKFTYGLTFSLWIITIYKLMTKFKNSEIKSYHDLIVL